MDAANGLIYVGNGQYYDPATGRFLTRQPGRINPYMPLDNDPLGLLCWRGRRKTGKIETIPKRAWAYGLTLLLVALAYGAALAACGGGTETLPITQPPIVPPSGTPPPAGPSPAPSQPGGTPQPPTSTPEQPLPCPTPTTTPTQNIEWFPENWLITHYTYALESDPLYTNNDKVSVGGLPPENKYRRGFIYGPRGVSFQGTGLAEDGNYITIDYSRADIYHDNVVDFYFMYGEGGAYGTGVPWKTVGTSDPDLNPGDIVVIEIYPDKIFTVTDTGSELGDNHLDVFVGAITIAEADALGSRDSRVGRVVGP